MRPDRMRTVIEIADRFASLGTADQKAILAELGPEERAAFDRALVETRKARADEVLRKKQADRQFLRYSQPIAQIVEDALQGEETELTPAVQKALAAEHRALIERYGHEPRSGWRGMLDVLSDLAGGPGSSKP